MKKIYFLLMMVMVSVGVWGQIYQHDFGTTAITTKPYTGVPTILDANLSSSSWTTSAAAFGGLAGNGGTPSQSLSLTNSSGTPTFTLTFNVAAGFQVDVSSFNFWRVRSNTGAQNWAMTINGISVGSGTIPTTGATLGTTLVSNVVSGLTGTVTVVITFSGASGSGTCRVDDFTLNGSVTSISIPIPTTTSINPSSATAGGAGFSLTVNGTNFVNGVSTVRWNGSDRTTAFVSSTELTATINAADIAAAGSATVTVLNTGNPTESNGQTFTINAGGTPLITVSTTALTSFGAVVAPGNSAERTYTVEGTNLGGNITIQAPAGVEISLTSNTYTGTTGNSIPLTPSSGTVLTTNIYARFSPATATGFLNANITHTSPSATQRNVNVTGFAVVASPTLQSSITIGAISNTTIDLTLSGGDGLARLVVAKQGSAVDVDPADGPVYFDGGGIFTNGTDLGGGNFVVFDGAGTTVNVTGLTAGTTYHFAVYSYNSAGPGTINYLTPGGVNNAATTSPPLGVQLALANTSYKINFDNTLAESNTGSFNGANINTSGSSGSLNSNAWAINDIASTGAATFGTTYPLGTGLQNPGFSTASNFFGMNIGLGNVALGIQPTGAYFSPGNVTLRIQNRTGSVLTKLNLSYILYVVNDQARSNSFNFAYSTDNSLYNNQATLDYTSTVAIQNTDLRAQYRSTEITGLSIPDQGFIYLRWYGDDVAGTGSRDEFALDDIDIIANSTSVIPTISGSPENVVINTNTNAGGDITIASDLNLVNGLLTLGNNNLTTLTITGGSATSYIRTNGSGALTVNNITTGKTLPIGNAKYNPLIIENGSGHNWTAKVDDGITADGGFTTDKAVLVTWDITPSINPTAAPADITFQFDEAATPTGQTGVNFSTGTNVQAWRRPSGAWLTTGAPAAVNTTVPNAATVKILGLSNFSPFGLSSIDGPLPVKFGNVKAYQQGNGIKVDWSNLTESGVVNYTIERSANGQLFTPLGTVNPTANNSNRADYSYFDAAPLTGINFYRIQSLEVDGKKLFSTIVRVSTKAGQTDITIYPNPVSGNRVSFQATALPKGQYMVRVTNAAGQQVMSKSLLHTGGSVTEVLELPATIKTGMYNILLSGADIKLTKTFIIR